MGVRIEDVARAAGVSMKTVSRVLNNEPNVAAETRRRVEEAARALQYRPHPSARSLAGQRSFLVALLYAKPSGNYLMDVQTGVLEACQEQGYHLMLAPVDLDDPEAIDRAVDALAQARVDGVVLTPPLTDHAALLARLAALGKPFASISPCDREGRIGVFLDERAAARDLTAHLIGLGHRRIAHILGRLSHGAVEWRLAGYRDALQAAGLPYRPELVVQGNFDYESGVEGAQALLAREPRPTAIFAANDDMAAGAIHAIADGGGSVPGEVSVCGFDDIPIARHIHPPLTTVRQPIEAMGRIAARELFKRLRDPGQGAMVAVGYELMIRRSTGPVAAR